MYRIVSYTNSRFDTFSFDLALRFKQTIQDLQTTTEKVSQISDAFDLRQKPDSLYPDGIFLAERVDICSPDEDEEEEDI